MTKIYVHGRGLVDPATHDNHKFNLFGQLPGGPRTLVANCPSMGELKAAKLEWAEVFAGEGIVLTVSSNKEALTVGN